MAAWVENLFYKALPACAVMLFAVVTTFAESSVPQIAEPQQPELLNYAGIDALKKLSPELTGSGVKIAVVCRSNTYQDGLPQNDYFPNISHNCFANRQFNIYDNGKLQGGVSGHSTAICSILFGEDPNAFNPQLGHFNYLGIVPQAAGDVYEFWYFLTDKVLTHQPPEADILTASFGSQFEDWWTRGIDSMAENRGLIVIASIGNGTNAYDPPLYPGAGANAIAVGIVNSVDTNEVNTSLSNFSLAYPEHSSCGPTSDGRCKPDIVTAGNCLVADENEPNGYKPAGNWSSFSTPIVTGVTALLVQAAKQDPNLSMAVSKNGGNSVMKAIILNSAIKLPYWHKGLPGKDDDHTAPLDYLQGAGVLNAVGAYEQLTAMQHAPGEIAAAGWDNNVLDGDNTPANTYKIDIGEPSCRIITATIAWNRHYDNEYPFDAMPEKDANLRLELWAVDPCEAGRNYLLDYSDSNVDNVEHIYTQADANFTNYELVVTYGIAEANLAWTAQRYGAAWNISGLPASAEETSLDSDIRWYDLNGDGVVDKYDFDILFMNMLTSMESPGSYLLGDLNSDGKINFDDINILIGHINLKADWKE